MKLHGLAALLATSLALLAFGVSNAQSPTPSGATPVRTETPSGAGSMVITGQVPAPAGTQVIVEVLDPATLQGTACASTASTDGSPTISDFLLTVPSECVEGVSGNLRICWGQSLCSALTFQAGSISVGLLSTEVEEGIPEGGSGVTSTPMVGLPQTGTLGANEHSSGFAWPFVLLTGVAASLGIWLATALYRRLHG